MARRATSPSATPASPSATPPRRHSIAIGSGPGLTRPLKTSESVARDIVHDIIREELNPGDSLPAEASMLERYGVSRESLREALRLLEVQGLITLRRGPGGGPVVSNVDPANLGRVSTLYYHLAGATYRELFEAWAFAEATLAERAARHPDAALRRERMEPFLEQETSEEELDDYVQAHARFHAAVGSLARNRVLELSLLTAGLIVSHHAPTAYDPRTLSDRLIAEHHEIAAAIIRGRAVQARTLMHDHITAVAELSSSVMGPLVEDFIEWR